VIYRVELVAGLEKPRGHVRVPAAVFMPAMHEHDDRPWRRVTDTQMPSRSR